MAFNINEITDFHHRVTQYSLNEKLREETYILQKNDIMEAKSGKRTKADQLSPFT